MEWTGLITKLERILANFCGNNSSILICQGVKFFRLYQFRQRETVDQVYNHMIALGFSFGTKLTFDNICRATCLRCNYCIPCEQRSLVSSPCPAIWVVCPCACDENSNVRKVNSFLFFSHVCVTWVYDDFQCERGSQSAVPGGTSIGKPIIENRG